MRYYDFPLGKEALTALQSVCPTPFYLYDEAAIRKHARAFYSAFRWALGFKNYFAVKALPNPRILEILKEEGMGADCSSLPELLLAEKVGFSGQEIMFTSNDTPWEEFQKARALGSIINLDDIAHLTFLEERGFSFPTILSCRYNPGNLRKGNTFIGTPVEAKYGMPKEDLVEAYRWAKKKEIPQLGLHTMVISNELKMEYFVETAEMVLDLLAYLRDKAHVEMTFINLGGGIGIPYRPEQKAVDLNALASAIASCYRKMRFTKEPPKLFFECGRMVTGPYGYLVASVRHLKDTYRRYVGLDASMADLMRPAIYGAYHHITIVGKEEKQDRMVYDVTGSLCENNDKFAIQRELPPVERGDLVVIHDVGAHGHAMGFNYNGKLRPAEVLLREDGSCELIRRREEPEDYFATLSLPEGKLSWGPFSTGAS